MNSSLSKSLAQSKESFFLNNIWIGGDMNQPDINWESNIISSHQYNKELNESFLSFLYDGNLDQLINFPTRKDTLLIFF